ncbi:MAG: hypothetical protein HY047_04160 [Acidobacteria bacterium]|nr:hypothetical protein [Acidobacteriota bacterium]
MTDTVCGYSGDRDEALIAYLYDDEDTARRAEFETHLAICWRCRDEVDALRGVRRQLARWSPPSFAVASHQPPVASHQSPATSHRTWWREIPAWAQVAAALLVLGVSAGVANLDVRYDRNGLSVRTGWSKPSTESAIAATGAAPGVGPAMPTPWRADLTALERQLRSEIRAVPASVATASHATAPARATPANDAEILRRVRALLDESEKRQQRELALRVGEVLRDVDAVRQADLRKIDRSLNGVQNSLGVEVLKQRESLNMLMRVSQRQ